MLNTKPRLSFIVPTVGRPTLTPLIETLKKEIGPEDEVFVVGDGRCLFARFVSDLGDPRFRYYELPGGRSGNPARDSAIALATGEFLMFVDDDDSYMPGAIKNIVRPALLLAPTRPHVFRVAGLRLGAPPFEDTIPGATFIPPNDKQKLGVWDDTTGSDNSERRFIRSTLKFYPDGPVLHDDAIYLIRPYTGMGALHAQLESQLRS